MDDLSLIDYEEYRELRHMEMDSRFDNSNGNFISTAIKLDTNLYAFINDQYTVTLIPIEPIDIDALVGDKRFLKNLNDLYIYGVYSIRRICLLNNGG